jgi:hypothetical protein
MPTHAPPSSAPPPPPEVTDAEFRAEELAEGDEYQSGFDLWPPPHAGVLRGGSVARGPTGTDRRAAAEATAGAGSGARIKTLLSL